MSRPRKLSPKQVERAAVDRQNGMSWYKLSAKYKCAINTVRAALAEYSDEFSPQPREVRMKLETKVSIALSDIDKIKKFLNEQFNHPL